MSVVAAIRQMLDAGLSLEQALTAAEIMEATTSARPAGTARQERNRRHYEKKKADGERLKASEKRLKTSEQDASEKRLKASESVLIQTPLARVRDNPSRLVISGQTDDDDCASAQDHPDDWPKANLIAALVEEIASPRLDHRKSPGLVQTSGQLAAWKRDGASWEHDVLPVVKALCAKSRTPIASWKFFAPAIAQSIADNRAALAIPEARQATGPPVVSITDRIAAENAEVRRRTDEILAQRAARNG